MNCCEPTQDPKIDIIGSVDYRQIQFALELEAPWGRSPHESPGFPQSLRDAVAQLIRLRIPHYVYGLVPREETSKGRCLLVSEVVREHEVRCSTYFLPESVLAGPITAQDLLSHRERFAPYLSPKEYRHVLLCVHGERDQCCGRLGESLWRDLHAMPGLWPQDTMLWRSTHIGGHKYAPTCTEFNEFRWWGRLDSSSMLKILNGKFDEKLLGYCYRGNATYKTPDEQKTERLHFVV